MIGIVRDTWRAVLVAVLLREFLAERPVAPPAVATQWQPQQWQPPPIVVTQQQPQRPLRRVGEAFVDLADSVIGVVRR